VVRKACTIWLGLVFLVGLNLTSAADLDNQDGRRPEAKPEAAAPAEPQQPPALPVVPLEPPRDSHPTPGLEAEPLMFAPDEPGPDDLPLPPLGPPGGAVQPGELGPGPPGGPEGLVPGPPGGPEGLVPSPRTDMLAGLDKLEADEAAQQELLASVQQSQHRLAALNDQLLDLRQQLRDVRRAIVEASRKGDYGKSTRLVAMLGAQGDLVQAELDVTSRHVKRVRILQLHLASMRGIEESAVKALADARASELDRLRATAARLEAEIRLHLQEQPSATPEQLEVLHARVRAAQQLFNAIYAMCQARAPGGEFGTCCQTAKDLAERRAELEFARGKYDVALKYQRIARDAARQAAEAAQAAYRFGTVTPDTVSQAQTDLCATKMKLFQWETRYGEGPPPSEDGQPPPVPLPTPEHSPAPTPGQPEG